MELKDFSHQFENHPQLKEVMEWRKSDKSTLQISGLSGSSLSIILASMYETDAQTTVFILNDADEAAYLYNDLRSLLSDEKVLFFPSSFKKTIRLSQLDSSNEILRTEALNTILNSPQPLFLITYPEAIVQKVISTDGFQNKTLRIKSGEEIEIDFLVETLIEYGFNRVDFVYEPGQFSVRGGIVDIFSFSFELPFRLDFFGDEIESIRVFDIESQLSKEEKKQIDIVPDLHKNNENSHLVALPDFFNKKTEYHFTDAQFVRDRINQIYDELLVKANEKEHFPDLHTSHITGDEFLQRIADDKKIEWGNTSYFKSKQKIEFSTSPQPIFHKNFDLIAENLLKNKNEGYRLFICSDSAKQTDRIASIFLDRGDSITFQPIKPSLHEGFMDHTLKIVCYTDHQIFNRFHKFQLKTDRTRQGKVVMTLKELNQLQVGDYVVHVDHGVGKFGGLVRTNVSGKMQEMVKLIYKDDDIIFVSIHSLHRISKYKGKEGLEPKINKLGSGAWERLKERTKSKIKDIARELIQLYAKRKSEQGFQYSPDSYLQNELEASFIYEDTPDQIKATADIKSDMESLMPMDRLVCGDVGFGKTEVAIRAAFKAVTDSKQVAVLVPTTVLAMQHYTTFKERLKSFPCSISYMSRAKSAAQNKETAEKLAKGEIDIIIGTHKLVGKTIQFKDLGLLIIDEEQKFGVSVKEKLKQLKVNVDTLTLTATPIPRTLQFSLLGARDLSIINTPPPNRYPVQTEIHPFDEEIIKDAIILEMNRNGQVFFINNRIQNIYLMEAMIKRLIPGCRVAVGHGQMAADQLENVIIDFIDYEYDVLIATTIIESGIDISNVNTIIINSAHRFGLSDLHQLRGRVGRSNRKAYCYLLSPEMSLLTPDARRRLQAIETFSELGSGFNIAMQDLDIRGAGNMLGAEQSGFISDLGYETYQRILNEAVHELKDEEFAELYANESTEKEEKIYVTDCLIDTDLEVMFSDDYIENVSERISLYRDLDTINSEQNLLLFEKNIEDRFGKMNKQSLSLLLVVRLRWMAMTFGIERLILKNGQMIAYLVSNLQSAYYQSDEFGKLLQYMTINPRKCKLREQNGKRSVVFSSVASVEDAWFVFNQF